MLATYRIEILKRSVLSAHVDQSFISLSRSVARVHTTGRAKPHSKFLSSHMRILPGETLCGICNSPQAKTVLCGSPFTRRKALGEKTIKACLPSASVARRKLHVSLRLLCGFFPDFLLRVWDVGNRLSFVSCGLEVGSCKAFCGLVFVQTVGVLCKVNVS